MAYSCMARRLSRHYFRQRTRCILLCALFTRHVLYPCPYLDRFLDCSPPSYVRQHKITRLRWPGPVHIWKRRSKQAGEICGTPHFGVFLHLYVLPVSLVLSWFSLWFYCRTVWILHNIRKEMWHFLITRQRHLIERSHSKSVQANTILITGIPRKYLTQDALFRLFNELPGGVKKIWINRSVLVLISAADAFAPY